MRSSLPDRSLALADSGSISVRLGCAFRDPIYLLIVAGGSLALSILVNMVNSGQNDAEELWFATISMIVLLSLLTLAFIAVWLGLGDLTESRIGRAIAVIVDRKAEGKLEKLRRTGTDQLHPRDLRILIPDNQSKRQPAMFRLLQKICLDAETGHVESGVDLMQPSREECRERLTEIERFQRLSLWVGIAGTFVGLLLAIRAFDLVAVGSTASIDGNVLDPKTIIEQGGRAFAELSRSLVRSLGLAFGTSVLGLSFAMFISMVSSHLRRRQRAYFQAMETAVIAMASLARCCRGIYESSDKTKLLKLETDLMGRIGRIVVVLGDLESRFAAQNSEVGALAAATDGLGKGFGDFNDQLKDVVDKIRDTESGIGRHTRQLAQNVTSMDQAMARINQSVARIDQKVNEAAQLGATTIRNVDKRVSELSHTLSKLQAASPVALDAGLFRTLLLSALTGMVVGAAVSPDDAQGPLVGAILVPVVAAVVRWNRSA